METISLIWKTKSLRNKIIAVVVLLLLTRVITHTPIPGVDPSGLRTFFEGNQFLNLLNIFSGGGLSNFSLGMIGVGPYITASIVMQLLTIIVPKLSELQKESGEAGRNKINQYTRWLTIPLAAIQAFGTIRILQSQQGAASILGVFTPFQWFLTILAITAGSLLIMWIGEIITEYGIGNGISLIIFAGIVAQLPSWLQSVVQLYDPSQLPTIIGFVAAGLVIIASIVVVTEAQRNIPVSYARRVRGDSQQIGGVNSHLPLRMTQAGVIPIIFAISVLLFPTLVAQFFVNAKTPMIAEYAQKTIELFQKQGLFYGIAYFVLIIFFTYFYSAIIFNPQEISENMQRNGGFVPGIRPGEKTANYLTQVMNRVLLPGAFFLAGIAVLPLVLQNVTGTASLTIGGTGLLIVVAVVIETIKQIEAQLTMHDYQS